MKNTRTEPHLKAISLLTSAVDEVESGRGGRTPLAELLGDPSALRAIADPKNLPDFAPLMLGLPPKDRSALDRSIKAAMAVAKARQEEDDAESRREKDARRRAAQPEELYPDDATLRKMETSGEAERIVPSIRNVLAILRNDPRWVGRLKQNTFAYTNEVDGKPIVDELETEFIEWCALNYDVNFNAEHVTKAFSLIASKNKYNPLIDRLDSLVWDGVPRVDDFFAKYAGCQEISSHPGLVSLYSRRFLLSMVARAYDPGCKVDTATIFRGLQGALKSTFFDVTCYGYFSDSILRIDSKDGYQSIMGVWLYEFQELDSLRRREAESVKSFLSARRDKFRPPYGRYDIEALRQVVFCGSTNEDEFLVDPTGSRRFWVVTVGDIDLVGLKRDLDQLWAESVHIYKANSTCSACAAGRCRSHRWWFDQGEEQVRASANAQYQVSDPWLPKLQEWSIGKIDEWKNGVHTHQVLKDAFGIPLSDVTRQLEMRLQPLMLACGWKKSTEKISVDGKRLRGYYPPKK